MTVQELNILVGQNIRYYRKLKGWYVKQLADKIGVTHWITSRHENGTTFPEMKNLLFYADVLGVEVSQLFEKQG